MIFPALFLLAALVCFIVAAATPKGRYGWAGMAILVAYYGLSKFLL